MWIKKEKLNELETTIETLQKLAENQERLIRSLSKKMYLPVKQPTGAEVEKFNKDIANVSKNESFQFYLMAIESEVTEAVRDCKIEQVGNITLQARGFLQAIERIRNDIKKAEGYKPPENSIEESDIIMSKLDQLINPGVN